MRVRTLLCVLGALLLGAATAAEAQQQFDLFATLVDATGASPATLQATDVRVMENGVEGKVLKIEPIQRRVTVQLLLDNGAGLGASLSDLRTGVRGFIEALPPEVEVTLVTTAPQPRFVVRATTDRQALLQGVDRLSPDTGAGRFVESLNEATQRIAKENAETSPVVVSLATTAGDTDIRERDVEQLQQRLQKRPTLVHVVLLTAATRSTGGANQTQVGIAVTQMTGGRFENITASSRIATLLPELGAEVAKRQAQQSRQFKLTIERPEGAKGDLGKISMGARGGLAVTALSLD
jgi:hypothetical protein